MLLSPMLFTIGNKKQCHQDKRKFFRNHRACTSKNHRGINKQE